MKVLRIVANICCNDVSKIFSVLWVETAFEDVLNAVVQEFQIPHEEANEHILCDFDGTSLNIDSFEDYVYLAISEGRVPKFRVIFGPPSNNNAVATSTSESECQEDVEQQVPQETDFSSRASNIFSKCSRIEENLNKAENELGLMTEPTPEVDIYGLYRELENRKAKLDLFRRALFKFESSLKTKEEILNQRDIDLNELRKRLTREACQKCEVKPQHYSVYQLENLLHGVSTDMNTRMQHLDEHSYALNWKQPMLNEEKNKIKCGRVIVKPKRKGRKLEFDNCNLDETEDETNFNKGGYSSNQQRARALSERVSMELETKVSKQKRKRSGSPEISEVQQAKLSGSNTEMIGEQAISMDGNGSNGSDYQSIKFNNRRTSTPKRKRTATKEEYVAGFN